MTTMTHEEQCQEIESHNDARIDTLERRFDRHLEIYANNGKELAGLKEEVKNLGETLIQQISGIGSDVKALNKEFQTYKNTTDALREDKIKKDGWIEWAVKTVFGLLIVAMMVAIGVNLK